MSNDSNIRKEMMEELNKQSGESHKYSRKEKVTASGDIVYEVGVPQYTKTLFDFCKWHVENQATKDLREHLRTDLKEVIAVDSVIDSTIDSMTEDDIRKSSLHSYKSFIGKLSSAEEIVDEMLSWGYQMPLPEKDPEHVYVLVKLVVDAGIDHEEAVNECDYQFNYDGILFSEILDFKSERHGESPVLYFP